ncbi:TM2 domain-containing protein [Flavimobilis sp. GY10621]|uniref:TM2 domain-containing protein n=2 Tax=Flavimobilis rhizosphaerae TaxID=2775421 RepID=A0ABR9DRI8_9MICO|nr:TM2 domain-containing protein [Flavimobilis rhizosphaerae]
MSTTYAQPQVPVNFAVGYPHVQPRPDLSIGTAYLLWFFLGFFGAHHFYLGKVGMGLGYLFTFGWLMIGWFVDLFTLPAQVQRVNIERRMWLR